MPIYEYECKDCKNHFELIQKVNELSTGTCPNCHSVQVERLISAAGFQLKGTGWYATDFKNKTPKSANTAEQSSCSTCPSDKKGSTE